MVALIGKAMLNFDDYSICICKSSKLITFSCASNSVSSSICWNDVFLIPSVLLKTEAPNKNKMNCVLIMYKVLE